MDYNGLNHSTGWSFLPNQTEENSTKPLKYRRITYTFALNETFAVFVLILSTAHFVDDENDSSY